MPRLPFKSILALSMTVVPMAATAGSSSSYPDLALLSRVTWGATATEAEHMRAIGNESWLQSQLHPSPQSSLPPAAQAMINDLPMTQRGSGDLMLELARRVAEAKAAQAAAAPTMQPDTPQAPATPAVQTPQQVRNAFLAEAFKQDQARFILRALYAPDQLREQMTAFWLNHFNVYADKGEIRLMLGDYEDQAIRPHAMGRFRDLIESVLRAPAMLQYLDNAQNAKGRINENYAREIMELHTMGVGSGYAQKDVQELARILTGVGVANHNQPEPDSQRLPAGSIRAGLFAFSPARHDMGDKLFLGHMIKGSGYDEVRQALDILCAQPATAQHISRKLAQYFLADNPPAGLVNRMAARWSQTGGDMTSVLDLMFHSAEFRASLSHPLLKDPQHFVISAVRMAYDDRAIANTQPVTNWLNRLGQPLYGHLTPDGYPSERTAWNGPGQIEQRFEIAQTIGGGSAGLFKGEAPSSAARPAFPVLQGALYYGGLDKRLSAKTRSVLDQATSPQEWNTLFLASPDFMGR